MGIDIDAKIRGNDEGGGPVFPIYANSENEFDGWDGMSLQQWYVGQIVKAMLSNEKFMDILWTNNYREPLPISLAKFAKDLSKELVNQIP